MNQLGSDDADDPRAFLAAERSLSGPPGGSGPGLVHSMRGDLVPADWPRLEAGEIQAVLAHWGLPLRDVRTSWHSPRPLSAAAVIATPDQQLFVKRHHGTVRTVAELEEEHRFIRHLENNGAPVPVVIAAPDGATAVAIGSWTYELHGVGAGIDLYRDAASWTPFLSVDQSMAAGHALGLLHTSARGYEAPARSTCVLVSNDRIIRSTEPLRLIEDLAQMRPALRDYLAARNWRDEIARAIAPFHAPFLDASPHLQALWTHNDWHGSNLLWSDASGTANVRTVLDFGLCDRTTAIHDLATAIERSTIPWLAIHEGFPGSADLAQVSGLIRGYLGARDLDCHQRAALPALLPLVHVGYALSEIDYFCGATRSTDDADLAYHQFLLGHCSWFTSVPGRSLLEHIRRELQERQ